VPTHTSEIYDELTGPATAWRLDPSRSTVEFHVPNVYGLLIVKGRFARFDGALDLGADPAATLTVDAASLDTGNARRDKHLRSGDFFDAERHPQVRFTSSSATVHDGALTLRGELEAAGERIPLELVAALETVGGGELALEAVTYVDQRRLGMTFSPLGVVRRPTRLLVRARLVPDA
jgi:polyisoprenoid-binding protein YceI